MHNVPVEELFGPGLAGHDEFVGLLFLKLPKSLPQIEVSAWVYDRNGRIPPSIKVAGLFSSHVLLMPTAPSALPMWVIASKLVDFCNSLNRKI